MTDEPTDEPVIRAFDSVEAFVAFLEEEQADHLRRKAAADEWTRQAEEDGDYD